MPIREPIAIVGIAAIYPGSGDATGFWNDIVTARDLITEIPPTRWLVEDWFDPNPAAADKTYAKRGAFLSALKFDALEFGIPPSALPVTDSAQLLGLIGAKRVLADAAGGRQNYIARDRISVILGIAATTSAALQMAGRLQRPAWVQGMRESGIPESQVQAAADRIAACFAPMQENTFPGLLANVVSGRIANRFDLQGSNFTTDAACASSLAAMSTAINELYLHNADMAITGGVDTLNDLPMFVCFSKTPALSPTNDCRPFSDTADGTMLGEGLGMFALRRLGDAERDGDRIYAVIRGVGASSDGLARSVYAPRASGQAIAIRRAYEAAGFGPGTVRLVEAHGTGTIAGDQAEFVGLCEVFGTENEGAKQWCALGSVKSQVGHTKGSAGAASLFKAAMALHHRTLPPTIKVTRPNSGLGIGESPFYLNTETRPWINAGVIPRRAALSSFGFGGTNFHMVLEEYLGANPAPRLTQAPVEIFAFSAGDAKPVAAMCRSAASACSDETWRRSARGSHALFDASLPVRITICANSAESAAQKLRSAALDLDQHGKRNSQEPGVYFLPEHQDGGLALLFSGQGSQYPGMGRGLAFRFSEALEAWDLAERTPHAVQYSLADVVYPRPVFDDTERQKQADELSATRYAQPALAAAAIAQLALLQKAGIRPAVTGGHSFGELAALHAAGCFSAEDLLRIAHYRGELMGSLPAAGAMIAVSHPVAELPSLLAEMGLNGHPVVIANYNSPRQAVLSGSLKGIEVVEGKLAGCGVAFRRLSVETAFHSPIVESAEAPFAEFLRQVPFASPAIPVYSNSDAQPYPDSPGDVMRKLSRHLARPVLFSAQIRNMYQAGARVFIEAGAGSALTQLVTHCLHGEPHLALALTRKGEDDAVVFLEAMAQLAAAGVPVDLGGVFQFASPLEPERSPSTSAREFDGGGVGRPYPPTGGATALARPNPEVQREVPREAPRELTKPLEAPGASARIAPGCASELHLQIAEAQKVAQSAILESLAMVLKSMETVAGGSVPMAEAPSIAVPSPAPVEHDLKPAPVPVVQAAPKPDIQSQLIAIVAEKTGYPADVLGLDMELESGLGIDSIKRVEIFSAVQQSIAGLPEVKPEHMASLRTLRQIVEFLEAGSCPQAVAPKRDIQSQLIAIVAEKTGYPADVLGLDMELESGLGIDSIKRVEIFSAVQQSIPGLPEVKPEHMASLRTLRQIVEFLLGADSAQDNKPPALRLARRAVISSTARAPGLPAPNLFRCAPIALTGGDIALRKALLSRLANAGVAADQVDHIPNRATGVIMLDALGALSSVDEALQINFRAFEAARTLAAVDGPAFFLGVLDLSRDHSVWASGISGIARTLSRERSNAFAKTIDIEQTGRSVAAIADALLRELLEGGPDNEVILRADGSRLAPSETDLASADFDPHIDSNSVVVATGGGRGVTAACVVELARETRARFALLGRTVLLPEAPEIRAASDEAAIKKILLRAGGPHPDLAAISRQVAAILAVREVSETLEALKAAGSDAIYINADSRDPASIGQALAKARQRFGRITGIMHGAGAIADRRIVDKTPEQFAQVFNSKVTGLRAILENTVNDDIDTLCLFSSVAARYGNPGQCDYAAANVILNQAAAVEASRRGGRCAVKSILWGPWEGGMVNQSLANHFRQSGINLIPLRAGASALVRELQQPPGSPVGILIAAGDARVAVVSNPVSMDVLVNRHTYPFLDDHRIKAQPVVPVVLVIEWLYRVCESAWPEYRVVSCGDLRVIKGIELPLWNDGGNLLTISAKPAFGQNGHITVDCEVLSRGDVRHYAGRVQLAERRAVPHAAQCGSESSVSASDRHWYEDGGLFHGPRFHVIDDVRTIDDSGIRAVLDGTARMGWESGPWRTDAAAMDGALQLIRLWTLRNMGHASLPTRIGNCVHHGGGPAAGRLECVVRCRRNGALSVTSDARLTGRDGVLVAELHDIEMHMTTEELRTGSGSRA
jgi:acyl transferase domain-containing protein/NADP-dependent 3-hydroxy acid dehydrogenase YdfG